VGPPVAAAVEDAWLGLVGLPLLLLPVRLVGW
jgi:hypothetical protein